MPSNAPVSAKEVECRDRTPTGPPHVGLRDNVLETVGLYSPLCRHRQPALRKHLVKHRDRARQDDGRVIASD